MESEKRIWVPKEVEEYAYKLSEASERFLHPGLLAGYNLKNQRLVQNKSVKYVQDWLDEKGEDYKKRLRELLDERFMNS